MKKKKFLGLNPAFLNITNDIDEDFTFFAQSVECDKCILLPLDHLQAGHSINRSMSTEFATTFSIRSKHGDEICPQHQFEIQFKENYEYLLRVQKDGGKFDCSFSETQDATNIYLPILWTGLAYFFVLLGWLLIKALLRSSWFGVNEAERLIVTDLGSPDDTNTAYHISASSESLSLSSNVNRKRRLRSLDAFRGFAMTIMIFVNYGGGKYWFFQHSDWNGLTVADLVFPWFMWIMGVSMVLSLHTKLRRGMSKLQILLKICQRSAVLFLIGIIINCKSDKDGYEFQSLRILGVLQRFALAYLLAGSVDVLFSRATDVHNGDQRPWLFAIRDVTISWPQWLYVLGLIIIHLSLTFFLEVPGCGRGYLGPGGLHMSAVNKNYTYCTGGAAGYIDRVVLGESHLYQRSSCQAIYDTQVPYDPEGLLGVLTATFLVFLGLQAGKILVFHIDHKARIIRWLIWGVVTGSIGLLLCEGSKNDGWIPINKNLWSLSFVLVLGSMAFILLPIFYYMIDVTRWWSGAPFTYAGMNSILLYIGSEFCSGLFPWGWKCSPNHGCYLIKAAWGSTLWVLISIYLYYKNFILAI